MVDTVLQGGGGGVFISPWVCITNRCKASSWQFYGWKRGLSGNQDELRFISPQGWMPVFPNNRIVNVYNVCLRICAGIHIALKLESNSLSKDVFLLPACTLFSRIFLSIRSTCWSEELVLACCEGCYVCVSVTSADMFEKIMLHLMPPFMQAYPQIFPLKEAKLLIIKEAELISWINKESEALKEMTLLEEDLPRVFMLSIRG